MKKFLKANKQIIETHINNGSEPLFEFPPVLYSPRKDANLSDVPKDKFSYIKQIASCVLTKNEGRSTIPQIVEASTSL